MENKARVTPGKTTYHSLLVNEENNHDMKYVYELRYQAKAELGHLVSGYTNMKVSVGQYTDFRRC